MITCSLACFTYIITFRTSRPKGKITSTTNTIPIFNNSLIIAFSTFISLRLAGLTTRFTRSTHIWTIPVESSDTLTSILSDNKIWIRRTSLATGARTLAIGTSLTTRGTFFLDRVHEISIITNTLIRLFCSIIATRSTEISCILTSFTLVITLNTASSN